MIKAAAIGTEGYAYKQLERIFFLDQHFELMGVCSEPFRREAGYQLCRQHGVEVFDDADTLLTQMQDRAEAVFIFTGIDSHYLYARQCLGRGFEVFLEKPPVPTIQQMDDLIALERRVDSRVAVLFQYLYSPIVQTLKQRLSAGEFGRVQRVRSLAAWQRPDDYFRRCAWCGVMKTACGEWVLDGTLNNPLAHMLSNSLFLAGTEPDLMAVPLIVQAELYRVHEIETEDTSSVRIVCENGCVITSHATLCSESEVRSETIVECEKAVIHYENFNRARISFRDGRAPESMKDTGDQRLHMMTDLAHSYTNRLPYKGSLEACRAFTLCVNGAFDSGGRAVPIDLKHAVKDQQNGRPITWIRDIMPLMQQAHQEARLLSEIDIPWARATRPVHMKEYSYFPSRLPAVETL